MDKKIDDEDLWVKFVANLLIILWLIFVLYFAFRI